MKRLAELRQRARFRWHAFIAALSISMPVLLTQLQVVDLKPIIQRFGISPEVAAIIVALIPFYIALLKPMVHFEDQNDCKEQTSSGQP
jgi:hypothetical protein